MKLSSFIAAMFALSPAWAGASLRAIAINNDDSNPTPGWDRAAFRN